MVTDFPGISDPSMTTDRLVSFTPEINVVDYSFDWWLDSGVNVHVCCNRSLFFVYQAIDCGW